MRRTHVSPTPLKQQNRRHMIFVEHVLSPFISISLYHLCLSTHSYDNDLTQFFIVFSTDICLLTLAVYIYIYIYIYTLFLSVCVPDIEGI